MIACNYCMLQTGLFGLRNSQYVCPRVSRACCKPLLGIFTNQDLSNIPNLCICSLTTKTLHYQFKTIYCPEKWQRGENTVSRNPARPTLGPALWQQLSNKDIAFTENIEEYVSQVTISYLQNLCSNTITQAASVYKPDQH